MEIFIKAFISWGPYVYWTVMATFAVLLYFFREKLSENRYLKGVSYRSLALMSLWFYVIYASVESANRYYGWYELAQKEEWATPFLNIDFFFQHVWVNFWLHALLSIFMGYAFYGLLVALRRYNGRFFEEGEPELGLVAALTVGCPNSLVFVPIVLLSVIMVSLVRGLFMKQAYTTMGGPILLALITTIIAGNRLVEALGLAVLRIHNG